MTHAATYTVHLIPRSIETSVWCDTHALPHIIIIECWMLTPSGVSTYTSRRCD